MKKLALLAFVASIAACSSSDFESTAAVDSGTSPADSSATDALEQDTSVGDSSVPIDAAACDTLYKYVCSNNVATGCDGTVINCTTEHKSCTETGGCMGDCVNGDISCTNGASGIMSLTCVDGSFHSKPCPAATNGFMSCQQGFGCTQGCYDTFRDCNKNLELDGCESEAEKDPKNCGECGIVCPGECKYGKCV